MPIDHIPYTEGQQLTEETANGNERRLLIQATALREDNLHPDFQLEANQVRDAITVNGGDLYGDVEFSDPGGVPLEVDGVDPSQLRSEAEIMKKELPAIQAAHYTIKHTLDVGGTGSTIWTTEVVPEGARIIGNTVQFDAPDGYDAMISLAFCSNSGFYLPAAPSASANGEISPVSRDNNGITIGFDLSGSWAGSTALMYHVGILWKRRGLY